MLTEDEQKVVTENLEAVIAGFSFRRSECPDDDGQAPGAPRRYLVVLFDEGDYFLTRTYPDLDAVEAYVAETVRTSACWWVHGIYDLASGRDLKWDYKVLVTVEP